jgi:FMN phosphatase YigB (HAD superfamily)
MSDRRIKVISFDLHKTLATPAFAGAVWYEGIPHVYAQRRGLTFEKAKEEVLREYAGIDENSRDYFDLDFWSARLDLGGYAAAIDYCLPKVAYYPEIFAVLNRLQSAYPLIVATSMPREFMPPIMAPLAPFFVRVFSSYSDYYQFKCPDFYITVCREMGITPREMVHVGDDLAKDYEMPRAVGVNAIHLDRKGKPAAGGITDLTQLEEKINYFDGRE